MNLKFKSRMPWALTFSFSRAVQQPALDAWKGDAAHVAVAQQALVLRTRANQAARRGAYTQDKQEA
jgi:fructose-bisphosphate aldolase class I